MNDMEKGFLAGFLGYALGARLDNTRFGRWFNTNPVINLIYYIARILLVGVCIFLGTVFLCALLREFFY